MWKVGGTKSLIRKCNWTWVQEEPDFADDDADSIEGFDELIETFKNDAVLEEEILKSDLIKHLDKV